MSEIIRIPFPHEGNPHYPLPADYYNPSNTAEYARMARVNACKQWRLPFDDIEDKVRARVESLRFFDLYYLWPDLESDWDPMFYDDDPRETPAFHWAIIAAQARYRLNLILAPRGAAKSTLRFKDIIHVLMTRPGYSYQYTTSTHDNATVAGDKVRTQVYMNDRIQDDFRALDEFGGRIKPQRGEGLTATKHFFLTNGSWLRCASVGSRQRGARPRRYALDDPEYDANSTESVSKLREETASMVEKVILPMMFRPDVGADWIGTFVSLKHMLYNAMATKTLDNGQVIAKNPIYNLWNRLFIRAAMHNEETGEIESCWPDMWPIDNKTRDANPRLAGTITIEEMPFIIGQKVFNSEMMGLPDNDDGSGFAVLTEERHGYELVDVDELFETDPSRSKTIVRWHRTNRDDAGRFDRVEMTLEDLLANSITALTVDNARTHKDTSDWKVVTLLALLHKHNELFVLDIYGTKDRPGLFVKKIFEMGDRWRASMLCPEHTSESEGLIADLRSALQTRAVEHYGISHEPRFLPYKPGKIDKTSRIERLNYRFDYGLIKLPFWLRHKMHWMELFGQIEGFDPGAPDGGLEKDDHIDTVSMGNSIFSTSKDHILRLKDSDNPAAAEFDLLRHMNGEPMPEHLRMLSQHEFVIDIRHMPSSLIEKALQPQEADHGPTGKQEFI